ncbi:unnamed protein product [Mytilus edulis]|uniref:Uncharacterized protein n=1 Tax=Mytilus edulis TaxID=6550 RepID=A0A8S3RNA3_MYTED|nr:unnamed protein product [Mytilus edulis]
MMPKEQVFEPVVAAFNTMLQCVNGLQKSVDTLMTERLYDNSKQYNLHQWYKSSNMAPSIQNTPEALHHGLNRTGVRSDDFTNVDIVYTGLQKNRLWEGGRHVKLMKDKEAMAYKNPKPGTFSKYQTEDRLIKTERMKKTRLIKGPTRIGGKLQTHDKKWSVFLLLRTKLQTETERQLGRGNSKEGALLKRLTYEMLSRRHNTATLTRNLRRFKGDEMPDYARIPKALFNPQLGSSDTDLYLRGNFQDFNENIRTSFRDPMLQAATEHSENALL